MKKKILSLFLALAAASAWGRPEVGKSDYFPLERNIAVELNAPGAVRAEIAIAIPSLKEVQRFELTLSEGALAGGVYLAPGQENFVNVTAFDEHGEKLYTGSGYLTADERLTPQIDIRLEGKETKEPLLARFGTYRVGLGLAAGPGEKGFVLEATLFDAKGNHLPFKPDELEWRGLPEGFELLKYSCFRESLCIELPENRLNAEVLACMRDVWCSIPDPPDTRGPYWYVVTGRNHTCALTIANEIRCWGDNRFGQLRATASTCPASANPQPSNCSTVPLPIQCGAGEVCKFQSLTAGAERTCAVDTDGRAWCWGAHGDPLTGEIVSDTSTYRMNGEIEAFTANMAKVKFTTIDTDLTETCAISTTRALYCWWYNEDQLADAHIVNPGTQYQSVSVGKRHVCAVQIGGKFECWGANYDGQLNGVHTGSSGVLHPGLKEILTRGGHRPAAGATTSCAQDPNDHTICWGSPSHNVAPTAATGGWKALHYSYATSLATNTDTCPVSGGRLECSRICATALGGDLFCGNWKFWAAPTQLTMIPDPASDHYISWTQMDVGPNHVCAVTTQRDVWCFGNNTFGQFGTGTVSTARTEEPLTPANH